MAFLFRTGIRLAGAVGAGGIGYLAYLGRQMSQVFTEVKDLGKRVDVAEERITDLDKRLATVEEKTAKVDRLEQKIDEYQAQTWAEIEMIKRRIGAPVNHGQAHAMGERVRQAANPPTMIPADHHTLLNHDQLHFGGVETPDKPSKPLEVKEESKKRSKSPLVSRPPPIVDLEEKNDHVEHKTVHSQKLEVPTLTITPEPKAQTNSQNPLGSLFGAVGGALGGFVKGVGNTVSSTISSIGSKNDEKPNEPKK